MMLPPDIQILLSQLSRIPYENLSKAVYHSEARQTETVLMQTPGELITRHQTMGSGGTCFSLTWYLCDWLSKKGYVVYPVMCDRVYGKNTHCCAILEYEGERYLLDPGYLSFAPIRLDANQSSSLETVFNTIEVVPESAYRYKLNTLYQKEKKHRFILKDERISEADFFRHWKASFEWESMTYPVVTMLKEDAHYYFQKQNLYIRKKTGSEQLKIPPEKLADTLKACFGISETLTRQALDIFY